MSGFVFRAGLTAVVALLPGMAFSGLADPAPTDPPAARVTNVAQLALSCSIHPVVSHAIRLEGDVWWASGAGDRFVLHDETGVAEVEVALPRRQPRAGERVRLEGHGTITRFGPRFRLGVIGPVVDNDGEHPMTEKSGGAHLAAGLQPIRVEWFNGLEASGLDVAYEGPGIRRQPIPSTLLIREADEVGGAEPGLGYLCYTGHWQTLPSFERLSPVASGVVSHFDLSVAPQPQHVAVAFQGRLRVVQSGLYLFHIRSDDGARLFVGEPTFALEVLGQGRLPKPQVFALGQTWTGPVSGAWGVLEGAVTRLFRTQETTRLELNAGRARVRVEVGDDRGAPWESLRDRRVRVTGFCQPAMTAAGDLVVGAVLVPDFESFEPASPPLVQAFAETNGLAPSEHPVLTTAVEVHRLSREEAERGYAVHLGGVVTSVLPEHQAFTIQDATRGLYVEDHSTYRARAPEVGEFLVVNGVTDPSLFAPIVKATVLRRVGLGQLPEPIQPTWDQLMNGSLDAQWVELEGIVTVVQPQEISLLTRDGPVTVELRAPGLEPEILKSLENALVLIRGCLFASWDYVTHQVQVGRVRVHNADIVVKQPAPRDLFSSPVKTVAQLLQFDPQAGAFQRVNVSGQVLLARAQEHFLLQGGDGLRAFLMNSNRFSPGDLIEVVGFPELSGTASPLLRQAVARKVGQAPMPDPVALSAGDLGSARYDSTLVQVEGLLVGVRRDAPGLMLEVQSDVRRFVARVASAGGSLEELPAQTRLQLTGVYAGHGAARFPEGQIAGFELLIDDPANIVVLARPPWWTLRRLLIVVGFLGCGLAATALWITQLRRQVEQRSAELATEIKQREHLESERAIEQERARIARDLHDELGSGITEVSMLAARARTVAGSEELGRRYLDQAWTKAREMVTSLDEIVWAMDPHHDSLSSVVSYFSLYADRFLGLAGIAWRLQGPPEVADQVLDSGHRHQLFLVFKEALNNVVRHANASEVRLRFQVRPGEIGMEICDNGQGLPADAPGEDMSGLNNMRARIQQVGGRFEAVSRPGHGTTLSMWLPQRGTL